MKTNIFEKIKKIKHIEWIIAVVAIILMLVIYFGLNAKTEPQADKNPTVSNQDYCAAMQEKLAVCLSQVKSAGKVDVIINWEQSIEIVMVEGTNTVAKQIYPKVTGVLVFCQGGEDIRVRMSIQDAVSMFLGISVDKVIILSIQ